MAHTLLVILAIVLFVLAGLGVTASRVHLGWFGMACLALALLVV